MYHLTTTATDVTITVIYCYGCNQLKVVKPMNQGLETVYDPRLCNECNDLKWIDVFFKGQERR